MKKITVFVLFLFVAIAAQGQLDFGISGGVNFSQVSPETIATDDFELQTLEDSRAGYHIGVMSQISILGVFIQPELLFTSVRNDMMVKDIDADEESYFERKINRIDIPVVGGLKVGPARIGLGPVGSIIVSESSELQEHLPQEAGDVTEKINSMTWGLQFGAGINISNLVIDVKYEYGLSKLGDGVTVGGEEREFDSRPRQFIISLGVLL